MVPKVILSRFICKQKGRGNEKRKVPLLFERGVLIRFRERRSRTLFERKCYGTFLRGVLIHFQEEEFSCILEEGVAPRIYQTGAEPKGCLLREREELNVFLS